MGLLFQCVIDDAEDRRLTLLAAKELGYVVEDPQAKQQLLIMQVPPDNYKVHHIDPPQETNKGYGVVVPMETFIQHLEELAPAGRPTGRTKKMREMADGELGLVDADSGTRLAKAIVKRYGQHLVVVDKSYDYGCDDMWDADGDWDGGSYGDNAVTLFQKGDVIKLWQ